MLERFRTSPTGTQIAVIVAALAFLSLVLMAVWYFALRVRYETIFTRLRAVDAAAIVGALDKQKVPYRLGDAGTTISVPEDKADAARLNLAGGASALKGEVGFELFDKSDMGITDFAQKINFQRALQGELERTISTLDGVERVRVHLSMGDDRLFRQDRAPPKASVTLRMQGSAAVQADTVAGVQQLVSAAVPLLDPGAVVVLDETGRVMSANGAAGPQVPLQSAEKQAAEQYLTAKIRASLARVFGPDYIAVTVTAVEPPANTARHFDLGSRSFAVHVSLRPRNDLPAKARDDVRRMVDETIGLEDRLGDTVAFEAAQGFVSGVTRPGEVLPLSARFPALPAEAGSAPAGRYLLAGFTGAGALCLALLVALLRRSRKTPLAEGDRIGFAERLRSLVAEEAADGAHRV